MRVSIILGHPYRNSFNAAIAHIAVNKLQANGHAVYYHDLYEEGFNPIISAEELARDIANDQLVGIHQEEITQADGIVIIHPDWWGQPPAILKGWIDRVLRENVAYAFPEGDSGGGLPIGLLKAKIALCLTLPILKRNARIWFLAILCNACGKIVYSIFAA